MAEKFTYTAGYQDEPWTLDITVNNYGGTLFAIADRDGQLFVQMRKISGRWEVMGMMPKGFYQEDISAMGEEIDSRLQKSSI